MDKNITIFIISHNDKILDRCNVTLKISNKKIKVLKSKESKILDNSNILITGGMSTFGKAFVKLTLENFNPKKIIIFSRDEMKQWEMQNEYKDNSKKLDFLGDIRTKSRLLRALSGVDYVIHAAALKIVTSAEYNHIRMH